MTRPTTPNPPAALPAAPASPPDPPAGGAVAWPVFIPRTQDLGHRVEVTFVCPACGEHGAVDENTRLCKKCWRPVAMLTQVLRMMRDKEMP